MSCFFLNKIMYFTDTKQNVNNYCRPQEMPNVTTLIGWVAALVILLLAYAL